MNNIKRFIKSYIVIILLLLALSPFLYGILLNWKPFTFGFSPEVKEDYYSNLKDCNPYASMEWINRNTKDNAKIYIVLEPRGYYLDRNYIYYLAHVSFIDYRNLTNSNDLLNVLNTLNITHILINECRIKIIEGNNNPTSYDFYKHSWYLIQDLVVNDAKMIYNKNEVKIYEIL